MGITVKWNDKSKTVVESIFTDPWTLEEFIEARKKWHRMIKSVDYRVPIMLDMRRTYDPPPGIMRQFIAIHRTPHPRQGHIYIMGLNPLYERLSKHMFDGIVDQSKTVKIIHTVDDIVIS